MSSRSSTRGSYERSILASLPILRLPIDRQSSDGPSPSSDKEGNIPRPLSIESRTPTIFSIDVAVAKARNVAYYANPAQLQPIDKLPTVPSGAALTNRNFSAYLSEPRFPEGIDGQPARSVPRS